MRNPFFPWVVKLYRVIRDRGQGVIRPTERGLKVQEVCEDDETREVHMPHRRPCMQKYIRNLLPGKVIDHNHLLAHIENFTILLILRAVEDSLRP